MAPPKVTGRSEEQIQADIISHMNRDHQDSLIRYLRHYCDVSSSGARNAKATHFTLSSLSITTNPSSTTRGEYTIPLDPPLAAYSEARSRLKTMDEECAKGLGVSHITIKEYRPSRGWHLFGVLIPVLATMLIFSTKSNFVADASSWNPVRRFAAAFPELAMKGAERAPRLPLTIVAVHIFEAWWMDRSRLAKYNVPRRSALWYKWMLSTWIEGFPNFFRFDELVKQKQSAIDAAKALAGSK